MTERLRRMDWAHDRGAQIVVVLLVAVVLAAIPTNERQYANLIRITFLVLWYAIMAGAWNIIGGYAGQVSFGHAAFLGTGAYVTGTLWQTFHIDPLLTLPIAGLAAALYSVIVGAPTLRLRGPYFAIATIGVGEATRLFVSNIDDITGQVITHGVTGISLPNYDPAKVHYATVAVFVVVMITTILIREGRFGLGLFAINMDRDAAETSGVPTARLQVLAFAISAFFTACAGSLYAARQQFLDPTTMFGFDKSIQVVLMPVVGGLGTVWGPVFGALLFGGVQDQISSLTRNPYLPQLIYGLLLVLVVLFEPLGVAGLLGRASSAGRAFVRPRRETTV
ncbi:MAG: branched-chain amino acid ABC transporter permease [Chloroflexi bacterium]|nr:MAG: branched-chain amino acid ABC transporter permease [Chloroflexota bacterium]